MSFDRTLLICIGGQHVFGAERRVMRLPELVGRVEPDLDTILVLSGPLYLAAKENPLTKRIVADLEANRRLIVLPSLWPLHPGKNLGLLARKIRERHAFLCSYGTDKLQRLLRVYGLPYAYEVTSPAVVNRMIRKKRRRSLENVRAFLCVSPTVASLLSTYFDSIGFEQGKSRVQAYPSAYLDPSVFRHGAKEKIIVSGSRFAKRKNVHVLAKAVQIAFPEIPGWKVRILGQGEMEEDIRRTLSEQIEAGDVFVGYVSDLMAELERSSIFVSVIENDNYPSQSVIEAMASGNALLLSNRGESHRFMAAQGARNGTLVELSAEAIAEALVKLCRDPDLEAIGSASRDHLKFMSDERAYVGAIVQASGVKDR